MRVRFSLLPPHHQHHISLPRHGHFVVFHCALRYNVPRRYIHPLRGVAPSGQGECDVIAFHSQRFPIHHPHAVAIAHGQRGGTGRCLHHRGIGLQVHQVVRFHKIFKNAKLLSQLGAASPRRIVGGILSVFLAYRKGIVEVAE